MSDIFVSYAREDRERIAPLVAELEAAGFTLWWDSDISPGHSFSARIEEELDAASAVIVAWSEHSATSNWVQAEATEGLDRGVLVPVLLDDARVPLPFRRLQSAELQQYPKKPEREQVEQLKAALVELLNTAPKPVEKAGASPDAYSGSKRALTWITAVAVIGLGLAAWFWPSEVQPDAIPRQFSFEPVSETNDDSSRALGSLVEEVALGLQRLPGISVTLPDRQALPSGLSVRTSSNDDSVSVRVVDTTIENTVLEKSYDTGEGFNVVHDRITEDLAGLLGSSAPQHSFSNASAFRDYLVVASLLRKPPTTSLLDQAEAELSELTRRHPKFARAFAQLCSVQITRYRETAETLHFEAAEKNCHRALTLDDQDNEVHLSLSRLYLSAGRYERALEEIRRAGRELKNSSRVQRALGDALVAKGDDTNALAAYQEAIRIEPNYWRNANALGGYYFDRAEYDTAATYYGIETDLVRSKAMSLNNLAGALFMSGDEPAAIAAWRGSAEIEMTINTAMNLGSALFYSGDFATSSDYYREALVLAPEDQRIYGHLADALLAQGDPGYEATFIVAIEKGLRALQIAPDNPHLIGDLATYYSAIGDHSTALEYLNRIDDSHSDIDVLYDKLVSRVRLKDFDEAIALRNRLIRSQYPRNLLDRDANVSALAEFPNAISSD